MMCYSGPRNVEAKCYVEAELLEEIDRLAAELGISRSLALRRWVILGMDADKSMLHVVAETIKIPA